MVHGRYFGRIFGFSAFSGLGPDFGLQIGGIIHNTQVELLNARATVLEPNRGQIFNIYNPPRGWIFCRFL